MAAPTDDELRESLLALLPTLDLNTETGKTIRKRLEEKFGCDLKERKAFLDQIIDASLNADAKDDAKAEKEDVKEPKKKESKKKEPKKKEPKEKPKKEPKKKEKVEEPEAVAEEESTVKAEAEVAEKGAPMETEKADSDAGSDSEIAKKLDEEEKVGSKRPRRSCRGSEKPAPKRAKKNDGKPKAKRPGQKKEVVLSWALQEFMGCETSYRGDVSKKIWEYIKANNLKDPKDGRKIIIDEKLAKIFPKKKTITMFKMPKALSSQMKDAKLLTPSSALKKESEDEAEGDDGEEEEGGDDDDAGGDEDDE